MSLSLGFQDMHNKTMDMVLRICFEHMESTIPKEGILINLLQQMGVSFSCERVHMGVPYMGNGLC